MKVTIALVTYNNSKLFGRLLEQIYTTTDWLSLEKEIIIIDNSDNIQEKNIIDSLIQKYSKEIPIIFKRNDTNTMLASAMNNIIDLSNSDYIVYLCTSHTYIYHKQWLDNMVTTMKQNPLAAMGGYIVGWKNDLPDPKQHIHVQGGIFISPTKILKQYKYDQINYPHAFMDVRICERFLKNNLKLQQIPKMISIMGWISATQHESFKRTNDIYIVHSHYYLNL